MPLTEDARLPLWEPELGGRAFQFDAGVKAGQAIDRRYAAGNLVCGQQELGMTIALKLQLAYGTAV